MCLKKVFLFFRLVIILVLVTGCTGTGGGGKTSTPVQIDLKFSSSPKYKSTNGIDLQGQGINFLTRSQG